MGIQALRCLETGLTASDSRIALGKAFFVLVRTLSENGELKVESTASREQTNALLRYLFPRSQFLLVDFW